MLQANYDGLEDKFATIQAELEALRARNKQLQADFVPRKLNLPDAADLLNQFKAKRTRSKTDLADVMEILEMLEEDEPE